MAGQCRPRDAWPDCRAFPRLADLPAMPDMAIIAVPAESVHDVARDCIAAGVPSAVVWAGGFAEGGDEGRARQRRARESCAAPAR